MDRSRDYESNETEMNLVQPKLRTQWAFQDLAKSVELLGFGGAFTNANAPPTNKGANYCLTYRNPEFKDSKSSAGK